jgi:hypothetical protein
MLNLAKLLLVLGGMAVVVGVLILYGGKFQLGHLPGDFVYHSGRSLLYIPLGTALLFTIILSAGFWLYHRIR